MKDKLERLEALSVELNSLTDRLVRAVEIVEDYLVAAGVHVSENYGDWFYGKLNGRWCFYLESEESKKKFFNVTRDQKIHFFRILPYLLDLLENRLRESVDGAKVDPELLTFLEGYRERARSKPRVVQSDS